MHQCLNVTLLSEQSEQQPQTEVAIAHWILALCPHVQACLGVIWQCKKAGNYTADGLSPVHFVLFVGEVTRAWVLCPQTLCYPCS